MKFNYRIYSTPSLGFVVERRRGSNWEFLANLKTLSEAWIIVWNTIKGK